MKQSTVPQAVDGSIDLIDPDVPKKFERTK
jgi:hypothetical protein